MATYPTLLDIAKANGSDAVVGLIEEATKANPEITGVHAGKAIAGVGAARSIKGTSYKTLVRTGLPTVGFRNANEGAVQGKSAFENRRVECFIMNPRWNADKAVADAHEDGPESYIALEGAGMVEAAMQALGTQFYYGATSPGDAKGHPGLINAYDSTNMVVDAGGTTASTGSSLWAVKFGPKDVQWVYGANGSLKLSDVELRDVLDGSSNAYTAYVQELLAWVGVQVGSIYSVGRIKKLTEDSGKGLTDARIYDLLAKFPTGKRPDVLFCTRRSLAQLRASRTATNPTGSPAPTPTEVDGIPIVPTDAILNTEALTL